VALKASTPIRLRRQKGLVAPVAGRPPPVLATQTFDHNDRRAWWGRAGAATRETAPRCRAAFWPRPAAASRRGGWPCRPPGPTIAATEWAEAFALDPRGRTGEWARAGARGGPDFSTPSQFFSPRWTSAARPPPRRPTCSAVRPSRPRRTMVEVRGGEGVKRGRRGGGGAGKGARRFPPSPDVWPPGPPSAPARPARHPPAPRPPSRCFRDVRPRPPCSAARASMP